MKKGKSTLIAAAMTAFLISAMPGDQTLTKEGKATIINTETIGKGIQGYAGPTPVKIYIENGKITKVEALRNQEGPKYMAKAKKVLVHYEDLTIAKAKKLKVDAVTGATFTRDALVKNVQEGLKYYEKNK